MYPDSEHKAVDLEAGVVSVWNETNGVDAKKGKLSAKDQALVNDSLTLAPSSRRVVEQIQDQIGEGFEAIHYGRATEPISGTWSDFGGTDNTPKTDMIFKHKKTGEEIRVSVKAGDGQLMSAKKGEAMATFKSIMQVKGDEIKAEKGTVVSFSMPTSETEVADNKDSNMPLV